MTIHIAFAIIAALLAFSIGRWSGRNAEQRERGWTRDQGNSELIERMQPASPRQRSPASGDMERVKEALRQGQKINAIKIYRDMSGVGLKEAKDYVEALEIDMGLR